MTGKAMDKKDGYQWWIERLRESRIYDTFGRPQNLAETAAPRVRKAWPQTFAAVKGRAFGDLVHHR